MIADGRLESSIGFSVDHKFNGSVTGEEFRALAGEVSFNGVYDVDQTTIQAGTVTFNTPTPAQTRNLVLDSNVAVNTELVVEQLTWNANGVSVGTGQTVLTGSGVIQTPAGKSLFGTLINQGVLSWQDGGFTDAQSGLIQNEGEFVVELVTERALRYLYNASGSVLRHTNGAVANIGVNGGFENDGMVEVTGGGTLRIGRDRANGSDGDYDIADGRLQTQVGFGVDHKFHGSVTGEEYHALAGNVSFHGVYDFDLTTVQGGTFNINTPSPALTDQLTINGGRIDVTTTFHFDQLIWNGGGFINGAGDPILTGVGSINGPAGKEMTEILVNRGELTWFDGPISTGGLTAARLRNEGVFRINLAAARTFPRAENLAGGSIVNAGSSSAFSWLNNQGSVEAVNNVLSVLNVIENVSGTTLNGGEWIVRDGAELNFGARTITVNNATVRLFGPGSTFTAADPLADNRGVFEISEGRDFTTAGDLTNSGSVIIGAGSTLTVSGTYTQTGAGSALQVDGEFLSPSGAATFADGAALGGGGFVPGEVVIGADGVVMPGSSPGTLTVESLTLEDGAVYEWEFDGVEADSIVATDSLSLGAAATLRIVQLGGAPVASEEFVLFAYPSAQPNLPNTSWTIDGALAPDWDVTAATVTVDADNDRVLLSGIAAVLNPADFNGDGLVDAADYTLWRDRLGEEVTPFTSADGDGDGRVTASDYQVWAANYGATGVDSPAGIATPEPTAILLASLALFGGTLRRTRFGSVGGA